MKVASTATTQTMKLMKLGLSLFRGFSPSKCKTAAKMAVARIKLLRNKREVVVRQMRRDIAVLLQSGQDATARIRVEHVIREQNVLAANEFIELFCELVVARLTIITKQRECPADLKEGIASLIFAAPRCSEIPELICLRKCFEKKYGKDFVSAATDLRPSCGVNRLLVDKLSVKTPSGEVKLKIMKEIAKEFQIQWDTTESEHELLKPPEELIEGPKTFVSATSLPMRPLPTHAVEQNRPTNRSPSSGDRAGVRPFEDTAEAAEAAAESAKQAIAAAQAAAYLANRDESRRLSTLSISNDPPIISRNTDHQEPQHVMRRHSYNNPPAAATSRSNINFDESDCDEEFEADIPPANNKQGRNVYGRHSYNAPTSHSDIKFDGSDCEDEETEEPPFAGSYRAPKRPAPPPPSSAAKHDPAASSVHPKLPDYDDLAARFEALKNRKSQP